MGGRWLSFCKVRKSEAWRSADSLLPVGGFPPDVGQLAIAAGSEADNLLARQLRDRHATPRERIADRFCPSPTGSGYSGMTNAVIEKSTVGERAIQRIRARILPFFFVLYIIAYIDRANVTFAKLSMSADLKFSEEVFGLGAGIFFIGYLVLEIPGALIMERWSARIWIARILVTWGIVTVLLGFIHSAKEFYILRLLLGFAEAGFFPGLIVYLSRWFPWEERARAMGAFILAVPVSFAV